MPFRPFCGLRFDDPNSDAEDGVLDVSSSLCHRQDVVLPAHTDRPFDVRRLQQDSALVGQWTKEGVLQTDLTPRLYLYRFGYTDQAGRPAQCTGVWGSVSPTIDALALSPELLPAPEGLSEILIPSGLPLAHATDQYGYHHRLWPIEQTGVMDTIADALLGFSTRILAAAASPLGLASESDFSEPTGAGPKVGDLVGVGLVMAQPDTVLS